MDRVRIGFIGLGEMGQAAHLRSLVGLPGCDIVALAEPRDDLRAEVARRHAIPRSYADHRDMLASGGIDGLVCIVPFTQHGLVLADLAAAGVPVLAEKPIAASTALARRIRDAFRAHRTPLFFAYHKRSDQAVLRARAQIAEWRATASHGVLRYLRVSIPISDYRGDELRLNARSETPPPARRDPREDADYEELLVWHCHQFNLARHLLGHDFEPRWVDADRRVVALRSAEGVPIVIELRPFESEPWQESALVCFDRGWIRVDLPFPLAVMQPGRLLIHRQDGAGGTETLEPALPKLGAMRVQAESFVAACRGEATQLCAADEALRDAEIVAEVLRLQDEERARLRATAPAGA